jgi:hypothetical protein
MEFNPNFTYMCDQIVYRLDLLHHNNNRTYLLTYFGPFKVVSLGLYTVSLAITPPFEVKCSKFAKCVP